MARANKTKTMSVSGALKKGLIFLGLAAITFFVVFRSLDINELMRAVAHARVEYLLIALMSMALFVVCEALNIGRGLRIQGCSTSLKQRLLYASYGFFFSAITPSSSGGQPLQLYAMNRDRINVAQGALALIFELMSFQIATLALGLWGLFTHFSLISQALGAGMAVVYVGIGVNAFVLLFLLSAIFSRKLITAVVRFVIKGIGLFSKEKAEEWGCAVGRQLEQYFGGAEMVRTHPAMFCYALITSLVQVVALHSITYWVYLSLGLNSATFTTVLALQAVLYISVSTLPLPGAVGVNEGGFLLLYRVIFAGGLLGAGMLLARLISFYLPVVLTGCGIAVQSMTSRGAKAQKERDSATI